MNTEFVEKSWRLTSLLLVSDVEDLDILVDYLTDKGEGRLSLSDEVCKRLAHCKRQGAYSASDRELISDEIRLFGGNSLANLFRGNEGVPYQELVGDVGDHLKADFSKGASVPTIEEAILRKLLQNAFEQMSEAERIEALKELDVTNLAGLTPAAVLAAMAGARLGGFATYKMAVIVANAVAKAILGRGLSFGAGAALTRTMGVFLGPVGWVITGLWTIADLASPAYRVTVPCVVQVAYMRQKALQKLNSNACPKCSAENVLGAKFCSECGTPMNAAVAA